MCRCSDLVGEGPAAGDEHDPRHRVEQGARFRNDEIGAQREDVLRMVLTSGMKLALAGIVLGVGVALALARYVQSLLFEVTPFDPWSYVATAAVLLAVSALACYVPARRATAVDPLVALRAE